jgi:membrane protease YdiL (CAAX protease family)
LLLGIPVEPFALAITLLVLLPAAIVHTRRESGGAGVRALLRDALRRPRPLWWGLFAVAALPVATWAAAAGFGGAHAPRTALLGGYAVQLLVTAILVNIWEETAWTGFVQRRLMARWGLARGSVVTAGMFAGIPARGYGAGRPGLRRGSPRAAPPLTH